MTLPRRDPLPADKSSPPLDLSILAQVTTPEPADEPPIETDGSPAGFSVSEEPPPRRKRPQRERKETPPQPGPRTFVRDDTAKIEYRPGILVKPLRDLYTTIGTVVMPFNNPVGTAFIQNAEPCAVALDNAAKSDKQIRRMLMLMIQGSVWGQVIAAHMPILMAAAATMVPAVRESMNRVVPPDQNDNDQVVNPVSLGQQR